MRVRLTFAKTEAMRFTGNLDLHRTLERTIRRARLPLRYSQGFTPRPKLTLASALSLGFTSDAEMADMWLEEPLPLDHIADAFRKASPPGVKLLELEEVDDGAEKLQNALRTAEYVFTLLDPPPPSLDANIGAMLAADALPRQRKKKKVYDLRPLILELCRIDDDDEGRARLAVKTLSQEGKTGRADEILDQLGLDPLAVRVHRTRLNLE